jgi:putative addiction module component (TIGR02574 family)
MMSQTTGDPHDKAAESPNERDAWTMEIERRMAEYRAGRTKTIAWQEVRAHLHRSEK